jgi:hypothetical protein
MKIKLSPLAICLAFGLTAVAGSAQASWWSDLKSKKNDAVTLPVETPGNSNPPGHTSAYPNGRGWSAVEYDFIDVKNRIHEVKEDTEEILLELDDIDADLGDLLDGQEDLMDGQKALMDGQDALMDGQDALLDGQDALSDQIEDLAGSVEAQGNVLEVQVRVGAIIRNEVSIDSSSTVTLYVQVIQNGAGLADLGEGDFTYSNGAPDGAADICIGCVTELGNGLYMIDLVTEAGVTGNFAGTLAVGIEGEEVSIDSDDSNGASIVTFEIEEPILEPDPA